MMASQASEKVVRELDHLRAALRHVHRFGTAIDGGANIGLWTAEMAKSFERVVAFEPAEDTFKQLITVARELGNVQCMQKALWSKSCHIQVCEPTNRPPGRHRSRFVQPDKEGLIPAVAIDDLCLDDVGLIKLDIEGAELFALQGAKETLIHCRPVVILEELRKVPEKRYGIAPHASKDFLGKLGARFVEQIRFDQIYVFD